MLSLDGRTTEKNTTTSGSDGAFPEENIDRLEGENNWVSENEIVSQKSESLGTEEACSDISEEIEDLNNINIEVAALELVEENRLLMKAIQKGRRKYCYIQKDLEISESRRKSYEEVMLVRFSSLTALSKNWIYVCLYSCCFFHLILILLFSPLRMAWAKINKLTNWPPNQTVQKLRDQVCDDKDVIHDLKQTIADLEEANGRLETDLCQIKTHAQNTEKEASESKSLLSILEAENSDLKGVLKNTR